LIVTTSCYYVPDATVRLFSPQLYFIEEQHGELRMDKDGMTLETADGTKLSFPINEQNNLPLALPIPMDSGFTTFSLTDERVCLSVAGKTNQNITGPQK
jgi:hypothetical protein